MPDWLELVLVIVGYLIAGAVVAGAGLRLLLGESLDAESDGPVVIIVALCWPIFLAIAPVLAALYGVVWLATHLSWSPWKRGTR